MKFKFRLQKLLEARKISQDLAQRDFQLAMNELNLEESKIEQMDQLKQDSYLRLGELQLNGGANAASELQEIFVFQQGLVLKRQLQLIQVQQALELVEKKREILQQATIEYKMIERLKEKKLEEFRHEVDRSEQKEADEMSILRFGHKDVR